jgi:glutaredoxin
LITVYSKTNCPSCTMAKNILDSRGIEYEYKVLNKDYDVDELMAVCMMLGIRGTSFPIIEALGKQLSIDDLRTL